MCPQFGLMQIIGHEEALTILSRTVDPRDPSSMLEAVRLLAAICLVPPDGSVLPGFQLLYYRIETLKSLDVVVRVVAVGGHVLNYVT